MYLTHQTLLRRMYPKSKTSEICNAQRCKAQVKTPLLLLTRKDAALIYINGLTHDYKCCRNDI